MPDEADAAGRSTRVVAVGICCHSHVSIDGGDRVPDLHRVGLALNNEQHKRCRTRPMRQVEAREWWLWGFAVTVTLVLTAGIVSLTFSGPHLLENSEWLDLKEWVRGLACLVLLFDIYTVYQQLQLQRVRRELNERNQLFEVITENAAD